MIYADLYSSTPLAPEAIDAISNSFKLPGNSGSPHVNGELANGIIVSAKNSLARLINCDPQDMLFTSGATESNNLSLLGNPLLCSASEPQRHTILVSRIEHKSVIEPSKKLKERGIRVIYVPSNPDGSIALTDIERHISDDVALICLMAANNELGTIQPVKECVALAHSCGAYVHCDAAQAVGKITIDVQELGVDYLTISGHKMYGPQGIGALYVSPSAPPPKPLMFGGDQQRGLRPGTLPTPLIAAMGAAAEVAHSSLVTDREHGDELFSLFIDELNQRINGISVIGQNAPRLPGAGAIRMPQIDADELINIVSPHLCISSGSACNAGQIQTSHVLRAIGLSEMQAREVFRIFFGRYNTKSEAIEAAAIVADASKTLHKLNL